jgi:hypothetical protein
LQSAQMYRSIRAGVGMGLRFRRSIRLMPGVRVNLGLTRASLSLGRRGLTYNIGTKGSRITVGLPGSGISYSHSISHQNPVSFAANVIPQRKRFSATPFVILAFLAGLLYLAAQPTDVKQTQPVAAEDGNADIVGTIGSNAVANPSVVNSVVPIPRPRPVPRGESAGPPLQIVPRQ